MAVNSAPSIGAPVSVATTPAALKEAAEFEVRWAAWRERHRLRDIAVRRTIRLTLFGGGVVALAGLVLLFVVGAGR